MFKRYEIYERRWDTKRTHQVCTIIASFASCTRHGSDTAFPKLSPWDSGPNTFSFCKTTFSCLWLTFTSLLSVTLWLVRQSLTSAQDWQKFGVFWLTLVQGELKSAKQCWWVYNKIRNNSSEYNIAWWWLTGITSAQGKKENEYARVKGDQRIQCIWMADAKYTSIT